MLTHIIGIDPGTNTGIAEYDIKADKLIKVETMMIHRAMEYILARWIEKKDIKVYVEDPRMISWGGKGAAFRAQGAGSVKRDASILEDFLKDYGIDHQFVKPSKTTTKASSDYFKKMTGWIGRTSNHARDAALICYKRTH